jgi:hypothetical protein
MTDPTPAGAGSGTLDIPNRDVSDELGRAGQAFGDLIKNVGQSVATTQRKLNDTAVTTTTALAETTVDIIAVQETVFDDEGNIDESVAHNQRLPLITFIDPVLYRWEQVRLQGHFTATEIGTQTTTNTSSSTSSDGSSQGGLLVFIGGGRTFNEFNSTTTSTVDSQSVDSSVGQIRMYSELLPRHDIGVPKPRQSVQGPRIAVLAGEIVDIPAAGADPAARTMSVTVQYSRHDGTPIAGKVLSIETDGVPWAFGSAGNTTDTEGEVEIVLRRTFLDPTATAPAEFVVSVRKGIVSNDTTVFF